MSEESKESEIKVGDIVQIKSGSCDMTVQLLKGLVATVVWFDGDSIQTAKVMVDALKKVGN